MTESFQTPILLIIFNRPSTTQLVFNELRKLRPTKLFVAGDGPRPDKPGEAEKCTAARAIINQVDWPCEVFTFFRDENVGCKYGPYGGMKWFFEQVNEGIILEDDCLPVPEFFRFCERMLTKYRNDSRVMQISGNCFLDENFSDGDYYFSEITQTWGWATWKRAFDLMDIEMTNWPRFKEMGYLSHVFQQERYRKYWSDNFDKAHASMLNDVWDFCWSFSVMSNNGLSIAPNQNLISNIGFGSEGTHTLEENHLSNLPADNKPIVKDPTFVYPAKEAVAPLMEAAFLCWEPPFHRKVINKVKQLLIYQPKES